jgi:hypothetical protein
MQTQILKRSYYRRSIKLLPKVRGKILFIVEKVSKKEGMSQKKNKETN